MERVEFEQEQILAELKDLEEKGLFSKSETHSIMKQRRTFETSLIRRIPLKADFLRYAEYEMTLEALRRKRVARLKVAEKHTSISDYSIVRRQFQIFERALRKFKGDVGLWVQYIELAKKEGARALVGRISARAIQLHPTTPSLYIYAANHELRTNGSPAAGRALLQRGIRLNKESVLLWSEYVKFELGFVELLRRRWYVLGLNGGKETQVEEEEEVAIRSEEKESEEAQKEIMKGAIVKAIMAEAIKAIPNIEMMKSLYDLFSTCLSAIRDDLIRELDGLLQKTHIAWTTEGIKLHARMALGELRWTEEEFIDKLRKVNEEILRVVMEREEELGEAYGDLIEIWCGGGVEQSIQSVAQSARLAYHTGREMWTNQ
ncbi:hypothetical protein Clacol_000564 [Clathrus columnatus]|uniref:U3 small nucleolar RNA-associated protein 6 N-terminal domain-containing protein n=1 Tax=Clathrus columnatus TaxID=1419009 RepID=A0AAV5A165_9AGAM|nr:hypothetical protein Clacol_000564 [Clathrus columnatus]